MSAATDMQALRRALTEAGPLLTRGSVAFDRSAARALLRQMRIAVAATKRLEDTGAWERCLAAHSKVTIPSRASLRAALDGLGSLPDMAGGDNRALARIVCTTAHVAGLDAETLRGPRPAQHIVQPRQLAILLAAALTGASYARIGAALGGRHHTTVTHGLRRARERLETSDTAALMATEVLDRLESGRAGRAERCKRRTDQ